MDVHSIEQLILVKVQKNVSPYFKKKIQYLKLVDCANNYINLK